VRCPRSPTPRAGPFDERANPPPGIEFVCSDPEGQAGWASTTADVVRQLFERAERNVLVAGYSFDHGAEILAPLHDAMTKRGATVDMYLDIESAGRGVDGLDAYVRSEVGRFQPWLEGGDLRGRLLRKSPLHTCRRISTARHPRQDTSYRTQPR
jgi:hypothetical protein